MKVAMGADHAGVEAKDALAAWLAARGHQVEDLGTRGRDSVDYPRFAAVVGERVASGAAARGVLVCGSGLGMAIAANKVPGVRAVPVTSVEAARLSRQHNDANVLCLGARLNSPEELKAIAEAWMETAFEGGRHVGRVALITALERGGIR